MTNETKKKLFDSPFTNVPYPIGDGVQRTYKFKNGYGASVVRFKILNSYSSYTDNEREWELAVLKFNKNGDWYLTYETPITNDVIGHLKKNNVENILQKINKLKKTNTIIKQRIYE